MCEEEAACACGSTALINASNAQNTGSEYAAEIRVTASEAAEYNRKIREKDRWSFYLRNQGEKQSYFGGKQVKAFLKT